MKFRIIIVLSFLGSNLILAQDSLRTFELEICSPDSAKINILKLKPLDSISTSNSKILIYSIYPSIVFKIGDSIRVLKYFYNEEEYGYCTYTHQTRDVTKDGFPEIIFNWTGAKETMEGVKYLVQGIMIFDLSDAKCIFDETTYESWWNGDGKIRKYDFSEAPVTIKNGYIKIGKEKRNTDHEIKCSAAEFRGKYYYFNKHFVKRQ